MTSSNMKMAGANSARVLAQRFRRQVFETAEIPFTNHPEYADVSSRIKNSKFRK